MGYVFPDQRRGKPVWAIAYKDVDGRPRKERTKAANRTIARRILANRQDAVERARLQGLKTVRELLAPRKVVTLRKFSEEYMQHSKANKTPKGHQRDVVSLKPLMKAFGSMALRDINAGHVQRYIDKRLMSKSRRGGLIKPRTIHAELATLSAIFREAGKRELIEKNPVRGLKKPKPNVEVDRYLDHEEEQALVAHAGPDFGLIILAAIHSGLREQELANLTWPQVKMDQGQGIIIVRKTKTRIGRVVPMSVTLRRVFELLPRYVESPYVITSPKNRTKYVRFNNSTWRNALRRAGIENFTWHDLRHTFASRLVQGGRGLKEIKELMGHTSIAVTERYAHLAPDSRMSAVLVLDQGPKHAVLRSANTTHYATHNGQKAGKTSKHRSLKRKMLTGS